MRVFNPCKLILLIPLLVWMNHGPVSAEETRTPAWQESNSLKIAVFDVDATPPVGYQLAYDRCTGTWDLGLRAKGIILVGAGDPVVLVAIDWIGIGNESHREFRRALALAAGTTPDRVAVHTLHQHDAPVGDIRNDFVLAVLHRMEMAVGAAMEKAQPVTHIGLGSAPVEKVASNRRIQGPDGKIRATRFTATADPALRAEPEGLIDPMVSLVSFWNNDKPLAVMSFYATHPQSYYRLGIANPDFPGVARFFRQLAVPDALHIHFNGAGSNLGAGKYNDGSHENRLILAERLAAGMKQAFESSSREKISPGSVDWKTETISLPVDSIKDAKVNSEFLKRFNISEKFDIGCLSMGRSKILFMPGELFVEYQLAAKAMRPDLFVAMAAYGDYSPGYIPTADAFTRGGYEVEVARLDPSCETILMAAMSKLLKEGR
ncbi:MAG TPA: hypothetical protein PKL65_08830 [Bacteroidales bacterium]|nr:hypothetical protein [Bacteroidales bacterium]HQG76181.1 hypothetical protein [Bacteroidales bacterium]